MEFTEIYEKALDTLYKIRDKDSVNAGSQTEIKRTDELLDSLAITNVAHNELKKIGSEKLIKVKKIIGKEFLNENVLNFGFFFNVSSKTYTLDEIETAIKILRTYETIAKYYAKVEEYKKLGNLEKIFFGE